MENDMFKAIQTHSMPFDITDDLAPLIDQIGDSRIVLLGESSHGTSEYYTIRAALSKRLIEEKGFTAIAVEGDWPACQQVNSYVKSYSDKASELDVLKAFKRWPTWMWANEDVADLIGWLRSYNENQSDKVGFYGIDVYSLYESMDEIMNYLKKTEPQGADLKLAEKAFACFEPFNQQEDQYAMSAAFFSEDCIDEVSKLLASIRSNKDLYKSDQELDLNLKMNTLAAKNAENYYRTMVKNDAESWNVRDLHMVEALNEIRKYHGKDSKVIVWEHNTHVGDASATDMKNEGMINVGQIVREQLAADDVHIIGFGTNQGTVVAADKWGSDAEKMVVPEAEQGSWENLMHESGAFDKYLIFTEENKHLFQKRVGHRAIGVVYNPAYESYGNYVPSTMADRYNAFIYVDRTEALNPLNISQVTS
ncbi:erythromycin esterase family protein [Virgibacillus sp. DJP39]|uniref:erythromycin esterase family protein n=1 Tax=Virgibacillus sp. DJP39 TaxID=3409790 RepID=UPI003BB54356